MKSVYLIGLMVASTIAQAGGGSNEHHTTGGSIPPTTVTSSNSNTNVNHNNNVNKNVNKNTSSSKSNSNSVSNASAKQNQDQQQQQQQDQNQTQTAIATAANNGNGSNNTNVNYNSPRIPVSSAYSASLTSGFDTCLGSASAGVQTTVLGLTGGKTFVDKNCVLIKQVQLLREMGQEKAACFRARAGEEGKDIDAALNAAGVSCQDIGKVEPVVTPPVVVEPTPAPTDAVTHEELNDVIKKSLAK